MATGRTIRRHHYRRRPSSTLRLITIITAKVLQLTIMSTTMMNSSRLTYSCCHAFVARLTVHAASSTSGRGQQHQHHDSRRLKTSARGAAVGWGGDSSTILTCSSHNKVAAETKRCSVIMNRRTTSSSTTSLLSTAIDVEKEAAVKSKFISGSKTVVKDFGGITYRETSQRGGTGSEEEIFRVVFILGGPGAGKGTQCEYLLENYPCVHLSAGQLLREEAEKTETSPHAALISECLVEGKIVPVEISLTLLQKAMRQTNNKSTIFLIDGFPRNFDNLDGWTRCMTDVADVLGVLHYRCPLSILERRVMERSKDSGRSDDNLDSLRRRFKTFEGETVPVINTLRRVQQEQGSLLKVVDIAGDQSKEQVWEDTQKTMNMFLTNDVLSANALLLQAIASEDVDTYRSLCADELFFVDSESTLSPHVASPDAAGEVEPSREAVLHVMRSQEGEGGQFTSTDVKCAEMTFITGTKVSLSYDRIQRTTTSSSKPQTAYGEKNDGGDKVDDGNTKKLTFRETRIWSHQGPKGWRMVYFYRSPSC